jgi:hypothetical protein
MFASKRNGLSQDACNAAAFCPEKVDEVHVNLPVTHATAHAYAHGSKSGRSDESADRFWPFFQPSGKAALPYEWGRHPAVDAVHREAASKTALVTLDKRIASELLRSRSEVTHRAEVESTSGTVVEYSTLFCAASTGRQGNFMQEFAFATNINCPSIVINPIRLDLFSFTRIYSHIRKYILLIRISDIVQWSSAG